MTHEEELLHWRHILLTKGGKLNAGEKAWLQEIEEELTKPKRV